MPTDTQPSGPPERHPMICAHCGDPIPESPYQHTWIGACPEPGQPWQEAPRYHLHVDYPDCRRASGGCGIDPEEQQ